MSSVLSARFYVFNPSGKWKYEGEGILPLEAFQPYFRGGREALAIILQYNLDRVPGTTLRLDAALTYHIVIIPNDEHPVAWPLFFSASQKEP